MFLPWVCSTREDELSSALRVRAMPQQRSIYRPQERLHAAGKSWVGPSVGRLTRVWCWRFTSLVYERVRGTVRWHIFRSDWLFEIDAAFWLVTSRCFCFCHLFREKMYSWLRSAGGKRDDVAADREKERGPGRSWMRFFFGGGWGKSVRQY